MQIGENAHRVTHHLGFSELRIKANQKSGSGQVGIVDVFPGMQFRNRSHAWSRRLDLSGSFPPAYEFQGHGIVVGDGWREESFENVLCEHASFSMLTLWRAGDQTHSLLLESKKEINRVCQIPEALGFGVTWNLYKKMKGKESGRKVEGKSG